MITDEKFAYLEAAFQEVSEWQVRYNKLRSMLDDIKDNLDDANDVMVNLSGELMEATNTVYDGDTRKLVRDSDLIPSGES